MFLQSIEGLSGGATMPSAPWKVRFGEVVSTAGVRWLMPVDVPTKKGLTLSQAAE